MAREEECLIRSPIPLRTARRVVVAVIGATLIAIGLSLLFLPGPGLVVIAVGLAVLSSEFVWARRWLARVREKIEQVGGSGATERPARAPDDAHGNDP